MPISILFFQIIGAKIYAATEYSVYIETNSRCKLYWHGNKVKDTVIVKSSYKGPFGQSKKNWFRVSIYRIKKQGIVNFMNSLHNGEVIWG